MLWRFCRHIWKMALPEGSSAHHLFGGHKACRDHGVEVRAANGPKREDQQRQDHLQVKGD